MSKILIVDDATLMRTMIKNALDQDKENIILEARDGEEALELYRATKPDLVTMDITMDIKNGVESAKEIFAYDKDAKIIMITALGQEEYLKECIGAGAKDFIVKPFTKERVLSAVNKVLGS